MDHPDRMISDSVAMKLIGVPPRSFYRYLKDGRIDPPAGRIGKTRRGWTQAEIDAARMKLFEIKELSAK